MSNCFWSWSSQTFVVGTQLRLIPPLGKKGSGLIKSLFFFWVGVVNFRKFSTSDYYLSSTVGGHGLQRKCCLFALEYLTFFLSCSLFFSLFHPFCWVLLIIHCSLLFIWAIDTSRITTAHLFLPERGKMLIFNCSSHEGKGALALGEFIPSSHSRGESDGVKQSRLWYALLSACPARGEEGGLRGHSWGVPLDSVSPFWTVLICKYECAVRLFIFFFFFFNFIFF